MTEVAIITDEQFELLNGFEIGNNRVFYPVQDANDNYFLDVNDLELLSPYFDFVSTLELSQYYPKQQINII